MTYQTIVEQLSVDFGDNTMPVLCNDTSGIVDIGTDFVFDALNPACYAAGVLPSVNGSVPAGGLVNLARDLAPAISTNTRTVTATPRDPANLPIFDGKGWQINPTTQKGFQLNKLGVPNYRIGEPALEGFLNSLLIAWFKVSAGTTSGNYPTPVFLGQNGSGSQGYGGFIVSANSDDVIFSPPSSGESVTAAVGQLIQIGLYMAYNTGSGSTTLAMYLNGQQVASGVSGTAPNSISSNNTNASAGIGWNQSCSDLVGSLYRVVRAFPGLSGANPLTVVQDDYAYGLPRFS